MYLTIIAVDVLDCPGLLVFHGGTWSLDGPHNASLPMNDWAENWAITPVDGISPCNLLKDTLKYLRPLSSTKDIGISPDKLLSDRSKCTMLINLSIEQGIGPLVFVMCQGEDF